MDPDKAQTLPLNDTTYSYFQESLMKSLDKTLNAITLEKNVEEEQEFILRSLF